MGNHFHILVKMFPENRFSDEDVKKCFETFYGESRAFEKGQIPYLREKLSSLSEFMREIKVGFARYYNRRHNRRGYFGVTGLKASLLVKDIGDISILISHQVVAFVPLHILNYIRYVIKCRSKIVE
jgi:hypothetical protein